jgi:hypothetical protein
MKSGLEGFAGFAGCVIVIIAAVVLTSCISLSSIFKKKFK